MLECKDYCSYFYEDDNGKKRCQYFGKVYYDLPNCIIFKQKEMKNYKCPFCGEGLKNSDGVIFILERLHTRIACDSCGKETLGVNWVSKND